MDDFPSAQNGMTAFWVTERFPFDQIHFAFEHLFQFFLHFDQIQQTPTCIWQETDQNIQIAVRTEIITEYGAKERELLNFPAFAKSGDRFGFKRNSLLD